MMIALDLQSRLPIYEQLRARISELVLLGALQPDEQLPSVRAFAKELGINPNTVQKAYQELERDNIVYSVAGRGSFVSHHLDLAARLREQQLEKLRQAAREARSAAVPEESAVEAVRETYRIVRGSASP